MNIDLTTPSLLFPAITLLLLAYTNRFVVLANLIRSLSDQYHSQKDVFILKQISNLRKRVSLIRYMQAFGIGSLLLCVLCMLLLLAQSYSAGFYLFTISLILMALSLAISLWEVQISGKAVEYHLQKMENHGRNDSGH